MRSPLAGSRRVVFVCRVPNGDQEFGEGVAERTESLLLQLLGDFEGEAVLVHRGGDVTAG